MAQVDANTFLLLTIGLSLGGIAAVFGAARLNNAKSGNNKSILKAAAILIGIPLAISLLQYFQGNHETDNLWIFALIVGVLGFSAVSKRFGNAQPVVEEEEEESLHYLSDDGIEVEVPPHFRVLKFKWTKWNIKYVVLFLDDRLLFVKTGWEFDDEGLVTLLSDAARSGLRRSGSSIGGAMARMALSAASNTIGGAALSRYDRITEDKIVAASQLPIEEVLKIDKDNFEILYSDITSAKIRKDRIFSDLRHRIGTFAIEGKRKDKFDILPTEKYDECKKIVESFLSGKLK